jgi:hypothetical protein
MKGNHVWVLSYNAGVLGVFAFRYDAVREMSEYKSYGYKGLKVEEHLIG